MSWAGWIGIAFGGLIVANIVFFGVLVVRYVWDERKGKRE